MKTAKAWAEEWSGMTIASAEDVEFFLCRVQGNALRWAAKTFADGKAIINGNGIYVSPAIALLSMAEELEGKS